MDVTGARKKVASDYFSSFFTACNHIRKYATFSGKNTAPQTILGKS